MALRKKKIVYNTPEIPDPNWEFVEQIQHGKERVSVWRELKPLHMRSEVVGVTDEDGKPVYEHDQQGRRKQPRTRRLLWPDPNDPTRPDRDNPNNWREFITEQDGFGNRRKNFFFRADPKKVAAREAEEQRKAKVNEFFDNVTPEQLERLMGALGEEAEPEVAEPVGAGEST